MAELSDEQVAEIEAFEEEGELDDKIFGRVVAVGALVGIPVIGLAVYLLFAVSDINISDEGILALALWSALWAGLLIGAVIGLGVGLLRLEAKAREAEAEAEE